MSTPPQLAPLFAPGRIGSLALRNRILMCPMGDSLANDDGTVSDFQTAYFEARARGGAALLIVGSVSVAYPAGSFAATQIAASDDRYLGGLRTLADSVHPHGACIAAQLVHGGPNSLLDIELGQPLLVPSLPQYRPDRLSSMTTEAERAAMSAPMSAATSRYDPHVATEADLTRVISQFAQAAERVQAAGFDGIELHAGHGYLLDAFRSGASNRRDDRWGGSLDNRIRLLLDVVAAVRSAVGSEFPVWCRLNAVEHFRESGETLDETLVVAERVVAAGLDAIHVSAYADPGTAIGVTEAHTPSEPAALLPLARAVKARVSVPVITFGRLEPEVAAGCIADGTADFVAMGRKLLADPDLPNKLSEGRVDEVRPCIYQYRCIGNIFVGGSVACVANPTTAAERELTLSPAPHARPILVVGGGPAGLECSRLLAARGHHVTLWEAQHRLGGALAIAACADPNLDPMLGWLLGELARGPIGVQLGRVASSDDVTDWCREAEAGGVTPSVVVATGAAWDARTLPGASGAHVATVATLAAWAERDDSSVGARVVVVGGGKAGCSLGRLAAARGRSVTILEPSGVFASELGLPGRFRLVHELETAGVQLLAARADAITKVGVQCGDDLIAADTVILVKGEPPPSTFVDALIARGIDARAVGDCLDARRIEGAFLGAARLAQALD